jgi:hypothetical protein
MFSCTHCRAVMMSCRPRLLASSSAPAYWEREPPERAQSVVDGDPDCPSGCREAGRIRGGLRVSAEHPSAAEDVHDHREELIADVLGSPDVEVQAVLAEPVVGFEPAGVTGLERCGSFLVVGQVRVEGKQVRAAEAFGGGIGDAQPGANRMFVGKGAGVGHWGSLLGRSISGEVRGVAV